MNGRNIPIWRDRWSLQSWEKVTWPVRSQLGDTGAVPPGAWSPGQISPFPTGLLGQAGHTGSSPGTLFDTQLSP